MTTKEFEEAQKEGEGLIEQIAQDLWLFIPEHPAVKKRLRNGLEEMETVEEVESRHIVNIIFELSRIIRLLTYRIGLENTDAASKLMGSPKITSANEDEFMQKVRELIHDLAIELAEGPPKKEDTAAIVDKIFFEDMEKAKKRRN